MPRGNFGEACRKNVGRRRRNVPCAARLKRPSSACKTYWPALRLVAVAEVFGRVVGEIEGRQLGLRYLQLVLN